MTRRLAILITFLLFSILSASPNWLGHVFGQGGKEDASPDEQVQAVENAEPEQTDSVADTDSDAKKPARHRFNVDALNFDEEGFDWHTDWWKILLIGLAAAIIITLLVKACMMLLKLAGIIVCLIIASIISICLQNTILPWVEDLAPESLLSIIDAKYLSIFVAFLIGLIVSTIVGRLVHGVFSGKTDKKS